MCVDCYTCSNRDCKIYDFNSGGGDPCPDCGGDRAGQWSRRTAITEGSEMVKAGMSCDFRLGVGLAWLVVNTALVIDQISL